MWILNEVYCDLAPSLNSFHYLPDFVQSQPSHNLGPDERIDASLSTITGVVSATRSDSRKKVLFPREVIKVDWPTTVTIARICAVWAAKLALYPG